MTIKEELSEYRAQFMEGLRAEADYYETSVEERFLEEMGERLIKFGDLQELNRVYFGRRNNRNREMQIYGYGYDESDSSLSLIISYFKDTDEFQTLTNTAIDMLQRRLLGFLEEACDGNISRYCDDADPIITVASEMKRRIGIDAESGEILKLKFVILTNAALSSYVKTLDNLSYKGRTVITNVWALERIKETGGGLAEPLDIDISEYGADGIPCIKANLEGVSSYEAYLAIIPGTVLANIYLKYGGRLLEGNVRSFLSTRSGVNKSIRSTIKTEPEYFFTFNNGIATTASSIELVQSKSGLAISKINNLQIINGGQTTASLASAIIKKDVKSLEGIFVPMKLTIVKPQESDGVPDENDGVTTFEDRYQTMIERIARCANSQNAVKETDFFSNHPFHVKMEQLSRSPKLMAPPHDGVPYQTVWYYERARGKWEQEQMKMKEGERNAFLKKNPKPQRLTKEKFAKCFNAYQMSPHLIAKNNSENMKAFAEFVNAKWEKSKSFVNESFFKEGIASVLLFDITDRIVNNQPWYPKGGCKAQVVPYTVAKLISLIPDGKWLDVNRIWNQQGLFPELTKTIEIVAHRAYDFLEDEANGGLVRTLAQKDTTWNKFKAKLVNLPRDFYDTLVDKEVIDAERDRGLREERVKDQVALEVQAFMLGGNFWKALLEQGMRDGCITPKEISILTIGTKFNERSPKLPSPAQAKIMMNVKKRLEQQGIRVK